MGLECVHVGETERESCDFMNSIYSEHCITLDPDLVIIRIKTYPLTFVNLV